MSKFKKDYLMFFLLLFFILGIGMEFLFSRQKVKSGSLHLSLPNSVPSPTIFLQEPTPTPFPELLNIGNDLKSMQEDLSKIKNEDIRLFPPSFNFSLGIK